MALSRISVLISGRGSNMTALIDAAREGRIAGSVTHVICNLPEAKGLVTARARGIATSVVDHRSFASRSDFDAALAEAVAAGEPDVVVLAGFMRVLDASFVHRYAGRLINIHPSLLPRYPGLDTHRRALADRMRVHGCTVHYVTTEVDGGPIIAQREVPVLPDDTEASVAARVLEVEHRLLPEAVAWHCAGRLAIVDGRVIIAEEGNTSLSNSAGRPESTGSTPSP